LTPFPYEADPDGDTSGDIPMWPTGAPEVTETENPVVAQLVGVDDSVLVEVRERRVVPFGYRVDDA
jgi:hypothetical protein